MSTLSVCMIVKDEAAQLPHCLESLRDLATEVIVCDTGSTDDTVAIATQQGAQVHRINWPNNFATARNQALSHATGTGYWSLMRMKPLQRKGISRFNPFFRSILSQLHRGHPIRLKRYCWSHGYARKLGLASHPIPRSPDCFATTHSFSLLARTTKP